MKLCDCGCGQPAPISKIDRPERGYKKGDPQKFIRGHCHVSSHSEATRQAIAESGRGRKPTEQTRKRLSESKRGRRNPSWKGGVHVRRKRRLVYVGRTHPMANTSGYVLEHRLVMAGVLGRPLRRDEHVHHLDLDSLNNAPENLLIVTPSQHSRIHRLLQWHDLDPLEAVQQVLGEAFSKCR